MESTITAGEPANQQHEPEEPVTPTVATSESESAAAEKTVETETVAANSNEMLPTATMESAQNEDGDLVSETVHVSHLMGKVSLLTVRKYDSGKPKELINDIAAGDETIALIAHVFRDAVNNKEWLARGGIQLRALLKRDKDAGTDDSLVQVVYHVGDQAAAAAYWFKENQRHRSCPVSIDERNRVLKLQIGKQFSDNKIADVLGVCQATIAKWRQRLEKTGDVKPSSVRTGIDGRKRRVRAKKKGPTGDSPQLIPSVAAPEAQDAEPRDQSVRAEADDSTAIDAIAAVKGTGPSGGSPQFIPLVAGKDVEDADPLDWSAREEAEDDDEAFATDPLDPWTPYEAAEDTTIIAAIAALKDAIAQLRARGYTDRQIIVEGSLDPQDASAASTDLPYELNAVAPQGAPPRLTGEPSRAVSVSAQLDLPMDSGPRVTDKPSPAAEASSSEPPIVLQTDWAASHGLATQIIEINYAAQKKES